MYPHYTVKKIKIFSLIKISICMCCIFERVGGFPLQTPAPGCVLLQEFMHKPLLPHFHDGRVPANTSKKKTPQITGKPLKSQPSAGCSSEGKQAHKGVQQHAHKHMRAGLQSPRRGVTQQCSVPPSKGNAAPAPRAVLGRGTESRSSLLAGTGTAWAGHQGPQPPLEAPLCPAGLQLMDGTLPRAWLTSPHKYSSQHWLLLKKH